jgi:hypothetical protein
MRLHARVLSARPVGRLRRVPSARLLGLHVGATLVLLGCAEEPRWLGVERTDPADGGLVAVNQPITVFFSEPVDPFTVASASARIVDQDGHAVPGDLECGSRSVRFVPRAPVTPTLRDGSFTPGKTYRLELAGMPTSFALRSRSGRVLQQAFGLTFRVPLDPAELGLATPFLPVGVGAEPLHLDVVSSGLPRIAVDSRVLELRFDQPLLPTSVTPAAFRIWRLKRGAAGPEEFQPSRAVVIPDALPLSIHRGAAVRLHFDAVPGLAVGDVLYLGLADGPAALRDYRDREVEPLPVPVPIKVDPGDRVRTRDLDLSELELRRQPDAPLGFEVRRGRIAVRSVVEAGDGRLGQLVITEDVVIRPGGELSLADGRVVTVGPEPLDFTTIDVVEGAELRLEIPDDGGITVRVLGDVRIAGRLTLDGPRREVPWRSGDAPSVDALQRAVGFVLVAGGDVRVAAAASIQSLRPGVGCPIAMVAGGRFELTGFVPPGLGLALRDDATIDGVVEDVTRWRAVLTDGTGVGGGGPGVRAAAVTRWIPLPSHADAVDVVVHDLRGGLQAFVQVAPPHAIATDRPELEESLVSAPISLPLGGPIAVPSGAFVRVLFRATVGGGELPSAAGFSILER